jgi:iron-sulfur cluster repair protein YtfE (RIC family)
MPPNETTRDTMGQTQHQSDLIDIVHHEHDHLGRLFEDISGTFERIVSGESEVADEADVLETAADDLEVTLEEMLHHFSQEEEVLFVKLEQRFPELEDEIAELVEAHETMCDKTRWLLGKVDGPPEQIADEAETILEVLEEMKQWHHDHTEKENAVFAYALERIPEQEQQAFLDEMQRL